MTMMLECFMSSFQDLKFRKAFLAVTLLLTFILQCVLTGRMAFIVEICASATKLKLNGEWGGLITT